MIIYCHATKLVTCIEVEEEDRGKLSAVSAPILEKWARRVQVLTRSGEKWLYVADSAVCIFQLHTALSKSGIHCWFNGESK